MDGPARNTINQASSSSFQRASDTKRPPTSGRLNDPSAQYGAGSQRPPACAVIITDGIATLTATGRCDDGIDDRISSPKLV